MNNLKINDIPSQYQDIAEFMNVENFIDFCRFFGGSYIYIPNIKTFEAIIRDKDIMSMYANGTDIKVIARKYNVTTNYVRKIIKKLQ